MKKTIVWIVIIFGLVGIVLGFAFIRNISTNSSKTLQSPIATISSEAPLPFSNQPDKPQIAEPQTLSIPKISINASVEMVGEDSLGRMDVPKAVNNVGWYQFGYKPGEKGNAVIDGHLDAVTGAPAVFYNISQLSAGDEVIITDKNGKTITFEVTQIQSYPFDQVPLQEVFGPSDKPKLNLITCIGTWNVGTRNYSNRLVVYTELKS